MLQFISSVFCYLIYDLGCFGLTAAGSSEHVLQYGLGGAWGLRRN